MQKLMKLTHDECGKRMSLNDSRQAQLDMLDTLADYCDRHGLRYYLSGGTLLGAIRHHGFIPWDDDIDVNMPRPDCIKLYNQTKGKLGNYRITEPDMDEFAISCESYRVYNMDAVVESYVGGAAKKPKYYPLFIDIFPIEGLPDDTIKNKRHYRKLEVYRRMQRVSALKHMEGSNFIAHLFHLLVFIPAKMVGYRRWSQKVQQVCTKYSFDEQRYVGVMTAPIHHSEERVIKADYIKPIQVEFEGKKYNAPQNYHTYLAQLYGDYMKMPAKDKQVSHHVFNIYWRKK